VASETDRRWIHRLSPGGLHKSLGVPEGKKIPRTMITKAAHSRTSKVRRQAVAAMTLAKLRKRVGQRKAG